MKLHYQLLIALVLGLILGTALSPYAADPWLVAATANILRPIGQVFLRLIFMIVVPMVVSALIVAVFDLVRRRDLSGVVLRTLGLTVCFSAASVVIGIVLVNSVRPGDGLGLPLPTSSVTDPAVRGVMSNAGAAKPLAEALVELIPRNPIDSAVRALDGEMLSLMFFALVFGAALGRAPAAASGDSVVVTFFEQVFDACMRIVGFAMRIAPVAVFAIVCGTALTFGTSVLRPLALYVSTVIAGLLIQQFVVYAVALRAVAGRSPLTFFRQCREVYLYAFSTASSNATLPLSLDVAERTLSLPASTSRFVLSVGSTANQNGTALFEGVTVMFLAQAYGLDLTLGQQVRVMVMSIVAGIGTAGVPGGSLPMVLIVAQSVGIPAEGMALILGVDRLLDMCRTAVNVSGDLVIAAIVGRLKA